MVFSGALVATFFMGRCSVPPDIKYVDRVVTKEVQVAAKQEEAAKVTDAQQHRVVTITRYVYPDGRRVERVREGDSLKLQTAAQSGVSQVSAGVQVQHQEQVQATPPPAWHVAALVAVDLRASLADRALRPAYGFHVERRAIGPLSAGVFGLTSGVAGLSLSLEF